MNNWEFTLNSFRALGGVAENIEVKNGAYGRGIFPIDSSQFVKIVVPSNLLLNENWLQIDDRGILFFSDECDWDVERKNFYLAYLNDYGFDAKMKDEAFLSQQEHFILPDSLKTNLKGFGMNDFIFQKPSMQNCLENYKRSRRIRLGENVHVLFPIIELINHDEKSPVTFNLKPQLSVTGKFNGEVLINYHFEGDPVIQYQTYGFSVKESCAFSGAVSINIGNNIINISRFINLYDMIDKVKVPKVMVNGNQINLSFLNLGNNQSRASAKKIFLKIICNNGLSLKVAEEVFDGILKMNQQFFEKLLEELNYLDGNTVSGLRNMAKNQLNALN